MQKRVPVNRPTVKEAVWLTLTAVLGQVGLAALAAALAVILFAFLADFVAEGATRQIDLSIVHYFHVHQPAWLHRPLLDITWLANAQTIASVLALSVLLLILIKRFWPDAGTLLIAGIGGFGFVELVKAVYHRPRPSYAVDVGYSFPSGHSFLSTAVYGMLAYYLSLNIERRAHRFIWTVAILMILLIGSSRVLLGAHYPSDVLAGFASGGAWLWVCLSLRRLLRKRDWGSWRQERLGRLAAARDLLEELAPQRPEIEGFAASLLKDKELNAPSSLLTRLGLIFERGYQRIAQPSLLAVRPYDLAVLGYFLRAAIKRMDQLSCVRHEAEVQHFELPLRQLWTAQRGLFGRAADEGYERLAS